VENSNIIKSGSNLFGEEYAKYISPDTTLIYTDNSIATSTEGLYNSNNGSAIAKTVVVAAIAFMSYTAGSQISNGRINYQVENTSILNAVGYAYIRKQEEYLDNIYNVIQQPFLLDIECEDVEFTDLSSGHFMSQESVNVITIANELFADIKPMVGKELDLLLECISLNSPSKPSLPNRM